MQTPHKRSFAAEELKRRQQKKPWMWIVVGIVVVAIIAGGYVLYKRLETQRQAETETQQIKSIAVLPFRNFSDDKEDEYFSDGITDDILIRLSKISDLKVISLTSVMQYKDTQKTIPEIGKELNVASILEGTVRRSGNRIRISAQLINARTDAHLWSDQYDRDLKDIFAIQTEIPQKIVEALMINLQKNEKSAIMKRYTENTEAYELYLRGRYHWHKRNEEGLNKGLEYFTKAIEKDPNYALSYAGIADSYNSLGAWDFLSPKDSYPHAKKAAQKAIEIDETLAEAYTSLAYANLHYYWDWPAAENSFKQAISLNPNYAIAHHWYAEYFQVMGRFEEALAESKRAQELEPFSLIFYFNEAFTYLLMGRYDEALERCKKALELDSNFVPVNYLMGVIYMYKGDNYNAENALKKTIEIAGEMDRAEACLGYTYAISGEHNKAQRILDILLEKSKKKYVSSIWIALLYEGLGENDNVFEWLEKAYEERNHHLPFIKYLILSDTIRSDPRFKALIKKMGLPED